ncbi:MAG: response regulator [Ectothiorhodospiraceae bacterium]|nr:response regulator [Ectothiorhodospiraceae bacterium]MCH8502996.1 response regulator [Ectothiorhodospiraceae bacterium]
MSELRILVVDDDRLIASTLCSGLCQHGLSACAANDVDEAKALLSGDAFDLAIIDARMPHQSGLQLADWISSMGTPIPFFFLSAYADRETVSLAVEHGALTYLVKPVQVAQLIPVIHAALARARERAQLQEASVRVETTLRRNREISVAIGILMARTGVSRQEAFERLRRHAREQRRSMEELAQELISSEALLSPARSGKPPEAEPGRK